MGSKSLMLIISGVAIVTLLYLVYLAATFEAPEGTTTIVIPPPALQPAQVETESVPDANPRPVVEVIPEPAPAVTSPVTEPVAAVVELEPDPEPVIIELPTLNDSDSFVMDRLRELQNGAALLGYLFDEQLIRRFVVLVDNISRGNLPQSNQPYRPLAQEIPVRSIDENLFVMDESGFTRFNQAVDTFIATDTDQAMTLYRLFSPLFQQAYAEIGYRDVNFDDTLRRAIRAILETDDIAGPYQLVKPSVMYLYADTAIENMQDVQKQIIRLGPDNAEKLKAKMRQLLQQL